MKIAHGGVARIRCDSCTIIEDQSPYTKDKRPAPKSRDRFFDFVIPPSKLDPLTKKPAKGHFRGVASESDPNRLAALHACPGCQKKVQAAFAKKDPSLLPDGPLRALMMQIHLKYNLKNVRIN